MFFLVGTPKRVTWEILPSTPAISRILELKEVMACTKALVPERRHHVSGQSVVTTYSKNFYLEPHDEAVTFTQYACLIQTYRHNRYRSPDEFSIEDPRIIADHQFGDLLSHDHADEQ